MEKEEKLIRTINRRFNKGVVEYGLIDEGDKILVGLSGGKDSLALLELLAERSRIYKPRFSVVAAHVAMTNIAYESDTDYCVRLPKHWACLSCAMKLRSTLLPIPVSRPVFCVRGTGVRRCSLWQKSRDAIK